MEYDPLRIDIQMSKDLIKIFRLWKDRDFMDREYLDQMI